MVVSPYVGMAQKQDGGSNGCITNYTTITQLGASVIHVAVPFTAISSSIYSWVLYYIQITFSNIVTTRRPPCNYPTVLKWSLVGSNLAHTDSKLWPKYTYVQYMMTTDYSHCHIYPTPFVAVNWILHAHLTINLLNPLQD